MKNRIIVTLLLGLSASVYCGDAYDPLNPHESMNPWKPSKGEVKLRKKHWHDTSLHLMGPATRKLMDIPIKDVRSNSAHYQAAQRESDEAYRRQKRAFSNYMNARYYAQPTFPRIERLRDRFSGWIASWYR